MDIWTCLVISGILQNVPFFLRLIIEALMSLCNIVSFRVSSNESEGFCDDLLKYIGQNAVIKTANFVKNNGKDAPTGLVIGKSWIAYIDTEMHERRCSISFSILIIGFSSTIYKIKKDAKSKEVAAGDKKDDFRTKFTVYQRVGNAYWLNYEKIEFPYTVSPDTQQMEIVGKIRRMMKTSVSKGYPDNLRLLLSGDSGSGKSMVAYQLAKHMTNAEKLDVSICNTFDPSTPGDDFHNVYSRIDNNDNYLIVIVDEWDKIITKGKTVEKFITQINDKSSHNRFMDNLLHYDRVIFIATTNRPISWFKEELDESYVRKGRFDLVHEMVPMIHTDGDPEEKYHAMRFS